MPTIVELPVTDTNIFPDLFSEYGIIAQAPESEEQPAFPDPEEQPAFPDPEEQPAFDPENPRPAKN